MGPLFSLAKEYRGRQWNTAHLVDLGCWVGWYIRRVVERLITGFLPAGVCSLVAVPYIGAVLYSNVCRMGGRGGRRR